MLQLRGEAVKGGGRRGEGGGQEKKNRNLISSEGCERSKGRRGGDLNGQPVKKVVRGN